MHISEHFEFDSLEEYLHFKEVMQQGYADVELRMPAATQPEGEDLPPVSEAAIPPERRTRKPRAKKDAESVSTQATGGDTMTNERITRELVIGDTPTTESPLDDFLKSQMPEGASGTPTLDDTRDALHKVDELAGWDSCMRILQKHNVTRVSAIPEDQRFAFISDCQKECSKS
jgi:hypothetical protein